MDSGKSTTTGRLLFELGGIPERELEKLKVRGRGRGGQNQAAGGAASAWRRPPPSRAGSRRHNPHPPPRAAPQEEAAALGKSSFAFAFYMDRQKEERERGVTISCTTKEFFTDKYHYTIIDAPGALLGAGKRVQGRELRKR